MSKIPVSRSRSTLSRFLASPFSATKSKRARSASSGKIGSNRKNLNRTSKHDLMKERHLQIVEEYLTDKNYDNISMDKPPNLKDFRLLCIFLIEQINTRRAEEIQQSKDFENGFVNYLNRLGYPKKINKTLLRTVNTSHGWTTVISILAWLIAIIKLLQQGEDITDDNDIVLDEKDKYVRMSQELTNRLIWSIDPESELPTIIDDVWRCSEKLFNIDIEEISDKEKLLFEEKEKLSALQQDQTDLKNRLRIAKEDFSEINMKTEKMHTAINEYQEETRNLSDLHEQLLLRKEKLGEALAAKEECLKESIAIYDILRAGKSLEDWEYEVGKLEIQKNFLQKQNANRKNKKIERLRSDLEDRQKHAEIMDMWSKTVMDMNLLEEMNVEYVDGKIIGDWVKGEEIISKMKAYNDDLIKELQINKSRALELEEMNRNVEDKLLKASSDLRLYNEMASELKQTLDEIKRRNYEAIGQAKAKVKKLLADRVIKDELENEKQELEKCLQELVISSNEDISSKIKALEKDFKAQIEDKKLFQQKISGIYKYYEDQTTLLNNISLVKPDVLSDMN